MRVDFVAGVGGPLPLVHECGSRSGPSLHNRTNGRIPSAMFARLSLEFIRGKPAKNSKKNEKSVGINLHVWASAKLRRRRSRGGGRFLGPRHTQEAKEIGAPCPDSVGQDN